MLNNFIKVDNEERICLLSNKAYEIWNEYFPCILSKKQIDYMVDMFLSPSAIKNEIKEGYEFYLYYSDETFIGFAVVKPELDKLFISKLYIDKEHRGQGFASDMFNFVKSIAIRDNLMAMYLTVNKYNDTAIEVYKHKGFVKIDSVVTDIGNGYVMDDYIMECVISEAELKN